MKSARKPRCDLVGRRFGRLTVLHHVPGRRGIASKWKCACDCGSERAVSTYRLKRGLSVSCGCYRIEIARKRNADRHLSGWRKKCPEYAVWATMKARCLSPKRKDFERYGGRGIRVSEEWMSFDAFYADMGPRPSPEHSIERVDNSGPYSKENCRWATKEEQANNRSNNMFLEVGGVRKTVPTWARDNGLTPAAIKQRIKMGWSPERAVLTPMRGNTS